MSFPEHLQISIETVFSLFTHQDAQILTHLDIMHLLTFVFKELGMTRPVDQIDVNSFLQEFELCNKLQIAKQHFGDQKFLRFNKRNSQNLNTSELIDVSIPVQPFVQELRSVGCQVIERSRIRQFLVGINGLLQIPKPVEDEDIERFIGDFDRNGDGELETKDLEGIDCLRFRVRKCRRYS